MERPSCASHTKRGIDPVRAALAFLALIAALAAPQVLARETVEASAPEALAVSIYRDPDRGPDDDWNTTRPGGFAMISEDRTVTLPPGESTIRFAGVSEGMVAVSAIVTGLPGGTIEKNRNADLLSPAALVDGTLGNRVTITRTNPATGQAASEQAIVRTRADGGLVLETSQGFEAVRCAGLPEKLTFGRVPEGLSARPVFSINTRDDTGGTYKVRLTYLSWGFDWQANYVATLPDPDPVYNGNKRRDADKTKLTAWLTLLNDNGQSFENAELLAVAGYLEIVSNFRRLADPPRARPLRLTCYPIGSTARGSPVRNYGNVPAPPPPPPMAASADGMIVVTGSRVGRDLMESAAPVAVVAGEEQLGDLKLYRFPEPVTVAAKGQKQVAFLQRDAVEAEYLYFASCAPYDGGEDWTGTGMYLVAENDEDNGLGAALPQGNLAIFEPSDAGDQLVFTGGMRDYAVGQEVELELAPSRQVFHQCKAPQQRELDDIEKRPVPMSLEISNANPNPVRIRVALGMAADWQVRGIRGLKNRFGYHIVEREIPANKVTKLRWKVRAIE
ncbi:MAG: hypothetical protein ABJM58_03885 [Alteripontixanthobacter sp.]